jgi:4-amino-4-deoxy-L-arabinose transferase-like glycosyltransferase
MNRARFLAPASLAVLFFLYFFGLTRTGLIGPDEPRYADIGRAMAATGDWITPRLWGQPWFEKPALLYWMTGAGFRLGLGPDLAPRLPVALASVAFLAFFFLLLRREFGNRVSICSTAILATSAGWQVYSHIAITDLPMSAAFAAAMLLISAPAASTRSFITAGVLMGLAILAKGLVPLVLFIPALWFLRRRIRDLTILFVAAIVIAAPWYVLVTLRNGAPFIDEFFWKQHFGRFVNNALQHQQPFWYYVPVLLASLFPWTPLLLLLFHRKLYRDARTHFLVAWSAWGFVFFSASRNKLPGYLLPLLPALSILLGIALANEVRVRPLLAACGALLCIAPLLAGMLPQALADGLSHTSLHPNWIWILPGLVIAAACAFSPPDFGIAIVVACTAALIVGLSWSLYPMLDREVSGRALWLARGPSITCLPQMPRSQRYSIQYYAGRTIPDCK